MSNKIAIKFNDYGFLRNLLTENYNRYIAYKKFENKSENVTEEVTVVNSNDNFQFKTFNHSDIENINKISNSIVFISCLTEGIHSIDYFNKYNQSNFYIIFSNSVWNRKKYNIKIDYINLDYWTFLKDLSVYSVSPFNENYFYIKEYDFKYPKNNIFVSTTGLERKERDYLIDNLIKKINYNNFILKYQGKNLGKNFDQYDSYIMNHDNFNAYNTIMGDNATLSNIIPTKLYNQAYFNLVVESDIDYPYSFFPTEKIGKALLTGIPFIVYSTPRFLQNLRGLGFETYNEFWNEDYDLEFDYTKRADKIIDLVNQLESFDWQANREKLQQIANHNAALMLKNNSMFIAQFEKIRKTLEVIKDKDAQYLKENPQLFEWLDNNTV